MLPPDYPLRDYWSCDYCGYVVTREADAVPGHPSPGTRPCPCPVFNYRNAPTGAKWRPGAGEAGDGADRRRDDNLRRVFS